MLAFTILVATASAQCTGDLGRILDEALQRDLLSRYGSLGIPGYPDPDNHVLPNGRLSRAFDCADLIARISGRRPLARPPSFAWPALEESLSGTHVRWYLIHARDVAFEVLDETLSASSTLRPYPVYGTSNMLDPASIRDGVSGISGSDPVRPPPAPSPYGEEIYVFRDLEVILVRVATMRQFHALTRALELLNDVAASRAPESGRVLPGTSSTTYVHITENFPMYVADSASWTLEDAKRSVGVPVGGISGLQGDGYAIAILDSGVDSSYFPRPPSDPSESVANSHSAKSGSNGASSASHRVIYEACFSSRNLAVVDSVESQYIEPLCSEFDEDADMSIEHSASDAGPQYLPYSVENGEGGPCEIFTEDGRQIDVESCLHGTQVAYIAAGSGSTRERPARTPGLAPRLEIISLRIVSRAPDGYCPETSLRSCVVVMPLDALRALHHFNNKLSAGGVLDGRDVVAANLSFHVGEWCPAGSSTGQLECHRGQWTLPQYQEPCNEAFATQIGELRAKGVWTVVASGNASPVAILDPSDSDEETTSTSEPPHTTLGAVSRPACAYNAVAVSGTQQQGDWYPFAKIAHFVDFTAPAAWVSSPAGLHHGTSFAAPFVSAALVLTRQHFDQCGGEGQTELEWLRQRRGPMEIQERNIPAEFRADGGESFLNGLDLSRRMSMQLTLTQDLISCGDP